MKDAFSSFDAFILTTFIYTSSEEKCKVHPAKRAKKRFWCGACEAKPLRRAPGRKKSQPAPSHASRCSFRGKNSFIGATRPHPPLIDFMRFSRISLDLTSKNIIHISRTSRIFRDETCNLCIESCKGTMWGARVPLAYERASVVCPSVREPLSGLQNAIGFSRHLSTYFGFE